MFRSFSKFLLQNLLEQSYIPSQYAFKHLHQLQLKLIR